MLGLNLFSIRNLIQTEEDYLKTSILLKEKGYDFVQYSGANFDAEMIKRVIDKSELKVNLTHVPINRILNDTDRLMHEHDLIGCRNIGLGALMPDVITDEKTFKETVDKLNVVAKRMENSGFTFCYHHHNFEFYQHNGESAFDYIIKNAPNIKFTLDTYWLQYGGADIALFAQKLKNRIQCVHLKDYYTNKDMKPGYCKLGSGVMDLKSITSIMKNNGAKYLFVEQDNAHELPDGLEQVLESLKYFKENVDNG